MNLITYYTADDKRKVSKSLTEVHTFENIIIKDKTSLMDPIFILKDINIENLNHRNYCYLPKTGHYYFINDIVISNAHTVELHCHVDVLNTFKNDILNSKQYIKRQQNRVNNKLPDSQYPIWQEKKIVTKTIGTIPRGTNIVLTTAGAKTQDNDDNV